MLDQEISFRLHFYQLDRASVLNRVRRLGAMASPFLRDFILDALRISSPEMQSDPYSGNDDLVEALYDHYERLLNARLEGDLAASFDQVLRKLADSNHDIRLLTSVGAIVMRSALKLTARQMMWRPFEFAKCGMAMGSLFSFDMSVALHLQIEQDRAALAARSKVIETEIDSFRREVGDVVASVDQVTNRLKTSTEAIHRASAETAIRSDSAAEAIADTSKAMGLSTKAVQELESSIKQIASEAASSARLSHNAVVSTEQSGKSVGQLGEALRNIDEIAQMIGKIAAQTNLLSLNATIEAARAGAAGRGFAIVAGEVKTLALQTEKATSSIKDILSGLRDAARATTNEMAQTSTSIRSLSDATVSVSAAVGEQRSAVFEIRAQIGTVAENTTRLRETLVALASSSTANVQETNAFVSVVADLNAKSQGLMRAFQKLEENLRAA